MPSDITGVNHVGVTVSDCSVAVEFYTDVMGFEEVESQEKEKGIRWVRAADGKLIHLVVPPPGYESAHHIAYTVADFDQALKDVEAEGLAILAGPGTRDNGSPYVFISDPDGNMVELAGE